MASETDERTPEQVTDPRLKTKHGVHVRVGQVWRDCDKRMSSGNRKCRVIAIDVVAGKAQMQSIYGYVAPTWVSIKRMHKHSTGWELVNE